MQGIRRRAKAWFVGIGLWQTALVIATGYALYCTNLTPDGVFSLGGDVHRLWTDAVLFGFLGSLLNFSRKAYVYLITDKLWRIGDDIDANLSKGSVTHELSEEIFRTRLTGYYLYLATRPFGGLVIGPLVTMLILGGLTTLGKSGPHDATALSPAGIYLIYLFSFVGGYTSSDMFDYLSKAGGSLLARTKVE